MYTHTRGKLLNIKVPEEVFEGVTEGQTGIDAVDTKDRRIRSRGEYPSIFLRTFLKIRNTDAIGIHSNRLREWFGESRQKGREFLRAVREKSLSEIFDETVIDLCVFFEHRIKLRYLF